MAEKNGKQPSQLKIIIAILAALLLLSIGALVARVIYLNLHTDGSSTSVVPDNIIGETAESTAPADETTPDPQTDSAPVAKTPRTGAVALAEDQQTATQTETATAAREAATIALYKGHPSDNEKFQVTNMLPGDSVVQYFAVEISHHANAIVCFQAEVTEQTKNLADVLNIKITRVETGKVIYDGPFAGLDLDGYSETFAASTKTQTVAYYKIEVSLPTSTGNEYQMAKLMADFRWFVKDVTPLDPPKTGDYLIVIAGVAGAVSLTMIILLLFFHRRKKEDDYAEAQ